MKSHRLSYLFFFCGFFLLSIALGAQALDTTAISLEEDNINLSNDDIENDDDATQNSSSLLQASQDVFLRTVSFQWGNYFFNPRGLDMKFNTALINGVEMNRPSDGRPNRRNWAGLGDLMRYPQTGAGIGAIFTHQGSLAGVFDYTLKASSIRRQMKFSASLSNRSSYQYRFMATIASGVNAKGWAYAFSASGRFGGDPLWNSSREGAPFNGYSFIATLSKEWAAHSLHGAFVGAYSQRGTYPIAMTKEVKDLFGINYNPYWGLQEGRLRNERIRENIEPIFQLVHEWKINKNASLRTTAHIQFGADEYSRLQYYNQENGSPVYYRYLPSYAMENGIPVYESPVYNFLDNSPIREAQINWGYIYRVNRSLKDQGLPAGYTLNTQKQANQNYAFASVLKRRLSPHAKLYGALAYQYNMQNAYAQVEDLLGANYASNVDPFNNTLSDALSSAIKRQGDKIDYDALLYRHYAYVHAFAEINKGHFEFLLSAKLAISAMWREGKTLNQFYPNTSLGKSDLLSFVNPSIKAQITYEIKGRHFINLKTFYGTGAPSWNEAFPNSRYENTHIDNIRSMDMAAFDISYLYKSRALSTKLAFYYMGKFDEINTSYYYTESASYNAFVAESLSDMDTRHIGIEGAAEAKIGSGFTLTAAANWGVNTYENDPSVITMGDVLLPSDQSKEASTSRVIGASYLKGLRLSSGPQQSYHIGIEYLSPQYWRINIGANYFASTFVRPSAIRRTYLFANDPINKVPYSEYSEEEARELLRQEELPANFYLNVSLSKSWRIKNYYAGFQLTINNASNNTDMIINGYEQSRYSSFPDVRQEARRAIPFFGNKYWYNQGINFFLNLFLRF